MATLAWIAGRSNSVGFLLASRYLSRDPGFYTAPLLLLILTLSLSIFTASLALTLDNHLFDRTYYKVGADVRLAELGVFEEEGDGAGDDGPGGAQTAASESSQAEDSAIPESALGLYPGRRTSQGQRNRRGCARRRFCRSSTVARQLAGRQILSASTALTSPIPPSGGETLHPQAWARS